MYRAPAALKAALKIRTGLFNVYVGDDRAFQMQGSWALPPVSYIGKGQIEEVDGLVLIDTETSMADGGMLHARGRRTACYIQAADGWSLLPRKWRWQSIGLVSTAFSVWKIEPVGYSYKPSLAVFLLHCLPLYSIFTLPLPHLRSSFSFALHLQSTYH